MRAAEIVRAMEPLAIHVRAGLHTGEVETIAGKAGGLSVVIGSRIARSRATPEVLVSQTVRDLTAGSGLTFEDVGERELKGVAGTWRINRLLDPRPSRPPDVGRALLLAEEGAEHGAERAATVGRGEHVLREADSMSFTSSPSPLPGPAFGFVETFAVPDGFGAGPTFGGGVPVEVVAAERLPDWPRARRPRRPPRRSGEP